MSAAGAVAHLLPAPGIPLRGPSGASAHARDLGAALARRGSVSVFAAVEADSRGVHGPPVPGAVVSGVPAWPRAGSSWRWMREVGAARRMADAVVAAGRVRPFAWILERHSLFSDAGWRAADALGVPWVLEVNAPPVRERRAHETLPVPWLASRWERAVLRAAPLVAAVSPWLVQWLEGDIGCRRVLLLPNGTALPPGDRSRGRAALGLPDGVPLVGALGVARAWHGGDRLRPLAEALGARLLVVGPPAGAVAGALCPGPLHGQALADVLAACDLGVAPYTVDAPPWLCPLKVLDFRGQGVPVVGSAVGALPALVAGAGAAVPAGDDAALRAAAGDWIGRPTAPLRRTWDTVAEELAAAVAGLDRLSERP